MTEAPITYQNLFLLFESLGFKRRGSGGYEPACLLSCANRHDPGIRSSYGRVGNPADMLSTEVHLHARGISEEPLESLLSAAVLGK